MSYFEDSDAKADRGARQNHERTVRACIRLIKVLVVYLRLPSGRWWKKASRNENVQNVVRTTDGYDGVLVGPAAPTRDPPRPVPDATFVRNKVYYQYLTRKCLGSRLPKKNFKKKPYATISKSSLGGVHGTYKHLRVDKQAQANDTI